jgi:hypothetical protein
LALRNALPGVERRRKVDDREELIDQLWSVIELLPPDPEPQSDGHCQLGIWRLTESGDGLSDAWRYA